LNGQKLIKNERRLVILSQICTSKLPDPAYPAKVEIHTRLSAIPAGKNVCFYDAPVPYLVGPDFLFKNAKHTFFQTTQDFPGFG
jgi:hypothetical protein